MSLRSALAYIISPPAPEEASTDKRNEVAKSFFSSKRLLIIVAFGVLLVLNMLPAAIFHDVALVVIAYLLGESLTSAVTTLVNGWIKVHEVKLDIDYERLRSSQPQLGQFYGKIGAATSGQLQVVNPPSTPTYPPAQT